MKLNDMNIAPNFVYLNLEYIKSLSRGNVEMEARILSVLREDLPPLVDSLGQSIGSQDFEKINSLSHQIKSSFKLIGVDSAAVLLQQIEEGSKEVMNIDIINKSWKELLPVYDCCMKELSYLLEKYS